MKAEYRLSFFYSGRASGNIFKNSPIGKGGKSSSPFFSFFFGEVSFCGSAGAAFMASGGRGVNCANFALSSSWGSGNGCGVEPGI
ncbi:MAG: hypothetical protein LBT31_10615 [Synergistaceae bacterium]|nr:hypothetical protein [Synergistaceae bacterium]